VRCTSKNALQLSTISIRHSHGSLRRFSLIFNVISIIRRIASDRDGWSGCCLAHSSTRAVSAGGMRKAMTGSCPVAGRPLLVRQLARGCLAEGRQSPQVCGRRHAEPAAALAGNPTHFIESEDLDSRADRLDKAFAALHLYVTAFFCDTAQQIPGCSLNRKHQNKLFVDLQSEAVAVSRNAPEELRNHENWKVS
jgi:hypothetical protein